MIRIRLFLLCGLVLLALVPSVSASANVGASTSTSASASASVSAGVSGAASLGVSVGGSADGAKTGDQVFLSVGIVMLDPGVPEDSSTHRRLSIYPLIRKAESRFLPFLLRQGMEASQRWGAVRVMPESSRAADLIISGKILKSNGASLALALKAEDSVGRVWLDKVYSAEADASAYEQKGVDAFASLYQTIEAELWAHLQALSVRELRTIQTLSLFRYGFDIAPDYIEEYLQQDEQGHYQVLRLPPENDPMLGRIERIRAYEFLFVDTVDEQTQVLFEEMSPSYDLWRQFSREQALYLLDYKARVSKKGSQYSRGSFGAMTQTYGNYEWFRRQEQNQEELAEGFNNEVVPTVMDLDDRVINLQGNLQTQYRQWRDILRQMIELERGQQ